RRGAHGATAARKASSATTRPSRATDGSTSVAHPPAPKRRPLAPPPVPLRLASRRPPRREPTWARQARRLPGQPRSPRRGGQRGCVQPLEVVHGEQKRVPFRKPPQHVQEREGDEALLHGSTGVRKGKRHVQRPPLRRRQLGQHLRDEPAEEVFEPGEREANL